MTSKDHDRQGVTPDPIEAGETRYADALAEQNDEAVPVDTFIPTAAAAWIDPERRLAPLYAALATAQGEFPEIPKGRTATIRPQSGEKWSYKYSDLSDLIKAVRKPLAKNGLGFYQHPTEDGKSLATVVFHETGLAVTTLYPMHQTTGGRMHPAQNYSVGGTYAKRNGLSAALGVASEETIEGDQGGKTSSNFDDASGDGVLSVRGVEVPDGASKAEKAALFGAALERQMKDASTAKALEGVWRRNDDVIRAMQDHFQSIHDNIVETYEQTKAAIEEGSS